MAIGTSKVGALGGLVPGGTETFNASGTFVVPPGVKKVSITGYGGAGNPGNSGNAGNPGNAGSGGGGGSSGAGVSRPTGAIDPTFVGCGGHAYKVSSFLVDAGPQNAPTLLSNVAISGGASSVRPGLNPGLTGCAGTGGSAGNTGNPGNSGCASTGLCQTFPGGAGGNGGAAGNAGTGGAGGPGGIAGNPGGLNSKGNGGSGGTGAGSGGAGFRTISEGFTCPGTAIVTLLAGAGGGGAGVNTDGQTVSATPPPWGTPNPFNPHFNYPNVPAPLRPTQSSMGSIGIDGGGGGTGSLVYCSSGYKTFIGYGGAGRTAGGGLSSCRYNNNIYDAAFVNKPTAFVSPCIGRNATNSAGVPGSINASILRKNACPGVEWRAGIYICCSPGIPVQHRRIVCNVPLPARQNGARAGGGGGSGNAINYSPSFPQPEWKPSGNVGNSGGGGGGGRGGAGNAGGCGGAGNPGSPGTPSTVNCVSVTPGSPYPIVVGCGGQVVISWNPQ